MSLRGKSSLRITKQTLLDFMTRQLTATFKSEQVVVTDIAADGDDFILDFLPAKEISNDYFPEEQTTEKEKSNADNQN